MKKYTHYISFDVAVIGAGHAGCEAALAAARSGRTTLLMTQDLDTIAQMPCNPSIGGVGKGQLVRELDALGGEMGRNTDTAMMNCHMLNTSRGPAVQSPRAQCDKKLYQFTFKHTLERQENLYIIQDEAARLLTENGKVSGLESIRGTVYRAKAVIVTAGTFLRGTIYIGLRTFSGGRYNQTPSNFLTQSLTELGITTRRLKTGTPMRLNRRSIDFSKCIEQKPDTPPAPFSHFTEKIDNPGVSCWITKTNTRTAEIIRSALDESPLYSGKIKSVGPRYCPSIEDKVVKFPHHQEHHLFLEPEGFRTEEYYVNGLSTSLPEYAQQEFLHTVEGLEKAEIVRPGYAIEYDFFDPRQLDYSLQSRKIPGLFLAGQVNGTTGYEEAAAQGFIAGINASRYILGQEPFILRRDEAYIGVMIDDLVSVGVDEPYRMFTSRAEYRLMLRRDNADLRLSGYGFGLGLLPQEKRGLFEYYKETVASLKENGTVSDSLAGKLPESGAWTLKNAEYTAGTEKEYGVYIKRNIAESERLKKFEAMKIPEDFDYAAVTGLSNEAHQKLSRVKPLSLAQAGRIPGITPSEVQLLWIMLERGKAGRKE